MNVLLEGPILTQSGYGEHARLIFRALKTKKDINLLVNPLDWGKTGWMIDLESEEEKQIEEAVRKFSDFLKQKDDSKRETIHSHIHVGIPNEFQRKSEYSVCVTAGIETDRISKQWIIQSYKNPPNKIIFPSNHSKNVYHATYAHGTQAGQKRKIYANKICETVVVPYPVKKIKAKHLDLKIKTKFNFLSIGLDTPRKNLENLIKWFVEEFKNDSVGLILKTAETSGCVIDRHKTVLKIGKILSKNKNRKCKVYLLHGDLTEEELHSLYLRKDVHAYVTTTHGEGYGLPIFEAAYSGMPIVATDWSGHLDFLTGKIKENKKLKTKKLFAKIDYQVGEVPDNLLWPGVIDKGSRWAIVKERSFKQQVRKVYKNYSIYKRWAKALQSELLNSHKEELIYNKLLENLLPDDNSDFMSKIKEMQGYEDEIIL